MEPEYDEPMYFDPDFLPVTSVAAGRQGLWDYGTEVAGQSKKYRKQTRSGNVWLQRRGGVAGCEELPLWAWQISASTSE